MFTALIILAYVLELLILALGIWRGYKLGFYKSLVRTGYLVLIVPISALLANIIAHSVAHAVMGRVSSINNVTLYSLFQSSPETVSLVEALVSSIAFSVIFSVLFGILELLSLIKFNAISDKLTKKLNTHDKSKAIKWGGLGIGLFNGLVSATILLIPLCLAVSILGTTDAQALNALRVPADDHNHRDETYYVALPSSLLLKSVTHISDKDIPDEYSELRNANMNGVDEAPDIINGVGYALITYRNSVGHEKENRQAVLDALGAANAHSGDSQALPVIFTNLIKNAVDAWECGQSFLGINLTFDNAVAKAFVTNTLDALQNVNSENVHSIVNTLMGDGEHDGIMSNVFILQKNTQSIPQEQQDATSILKENSELVADTLIQLGINDDLQSVNGLVADIGSEYISEVVVNLVNDTEMNDDQVYKFADSVADYAQSNIKNSSADSYNDHVEAVSQLVLEIASNYNYPITSAEATIISVGLISYISETPEDQVSANDLLEYFGYSLDYVPEK